MALSAERALSPFLQSRHEQQVMADDDFSMQPALLLRSPIQCTEARNRRGSYKLAALTK